MSQNIFNNHCDNMFSVEANMSNCNSFDMEKKLAYNNNNNTNLRMCAPQNNISNATTSQWGINYPMQQQMSHQGMRMSTMQQQPMLSFGAPQQMNGQQSLHMIMGLNNSVSAMTSTEPNTTPASMASMMDQSSNPFEPTPILEAPRTLLGTTATTTKPVVSAAPAPKCNIPINFDNLPKKFDAPIVTKTRRSSASSAGAPLPKSISKVKTLLPVDYKPSTRSIICGNKRKYFESEGNRHFRKVCKQFLNEYMNAPTKVEKTNVVTKVMNILREDCPDSDATFVTPQGGRWYAVSERTAREKVGTFFRDCLADSYKSSAKNKIAKRKTSKTSSISSNNSATSGSTASTSKRRSSYADYQNQQQTMQMIPSFVLEQPVLKRESTFSILEQAFMAADKNTESNNNSNGDEDDSIGSVSFFDVDDFTPVPL
jgi:hypothetical protein